jgi:hypothetical protein
VSSGVVACCCDTPNTPIYAVHSFNGPYVSVHTTSISCLPTVSYPLFVLPCSSVVNSMDFVPEESALKVDEIVVDPDTKALLHKLDLHFPVKVVEPRRPEFRGPKGRRGPPRK